jgi:hypothetical protein
MIRGTNANAVLIYDPPEYVLDVAQEYGLKVVYAFAISFWTVGGPEHETIASRLVARVMQVRSKPALLAYELGNEIGGDVLQARSEAPILAGLQRLYTAVKAADPAHPVSSANWPPARNLNLGFLDFISFNVYPLWPPEVPAMGFGRYVDSVLRPIAGGKPLLLSEFGANTTEAGRDGQARLIRESWDGLLKAGAAGGFVFEFADEWWKNYNNPARPGDWWTRVPAPDDELQHDDDPEENYGLVEADRTPKPAFTAVSAMFARHADHTAARLFGTAVVLSIVLAAGAGWVGARRRQRHRVEPVTSPTPALTRMPRSQQ